MIEILALIVVLGILILLHEGGHFLAARAAGARVSVFSFGFGKRLFGFERKGTDYRVSLIPLGGYVRIHGLGPDESTVAGAEVESEPLLPKLKRAGILVAGPGANLVSAILFLATAFVCGVPVPVWHDDPPVVAWVFPGGPAAKTGIQAGDLILSVDGRPMETWRDVEMATMSAAKRELVIRYRREGTEHEAKLTPTPYSEFNLGFDGLAQAIPAQIATVTPGSPAEQAGFRPGDHLVSINGEPIHHFYDFMRVVSQNPGKQVTVMIERDGKTLEIKATPRDQGGQGKLGVSVPTPTKIKKFGVFSAIAEASRECFNMTRETMAALGRLITGRASLKGSLSGPIDIARFSGEAARSGFVSFIWFLGFISLQLAIFNLLPIPVLDGGHLAIMGVEGTIRRDLSWKAKERILNVGFWLLLALVAVVLYNDVTKTALFGKIFGK